MGNAMRIQTSLPAELEVDILLRLPLKSLVLCRCVCKSWCNFINSPAFIKSHLIKNQNHNYVVLVHSLSDSGTTLSFRDYESLGIIKPNLDIPIADSSGLLDACGPCDGLICIANRSNKIVLCNPSLRECREIPVPQFKFFGYHVEWMFCGGLGFDSNRNEYKVISFVALYPYYDNHRRLGNTKNLNKIQCVIYDVGIKRWREIVHMDMCHMSELISLPGVLYNGVLHWFAQNEDISTGKLSSYILCFDVNTEKFLHIRGPNDTLEPVKNNRYRLIAFNDSLALVIYNPYDYTNETEGQVFEIWVLKQDGFPEFWTKQTQFKVAPPMDIWEPLFFRKNEVLLLKYGEENFVSLSLDTNEILEEYEIGNNGHRILVNLYYLSNRILVNQESLVSIKREMV